MLLGKDVVFTRWCRRSLFLERPVVLLLCLALLPDGLRFASASWDQTARIVEHGLAPH